MATKKKQPKKDAAWQKKMDEARLRRDSAETMKDANTAQYTYSKLGLDKPLSRMDPTVPTDMSNLMGQMGAQLDPNAASYVGNRSQQMKDVLARMEGGLSGLTGPEMQAMRENAMGEIMRQRSTAMAGAAASQARSGVRGAAASAGQRDLNRDTMRSQQQFENKLMTDNIGVQDSRMGNYFGALSGTEKDEYGRVADKQRAYQDIINQRNSYTTGINQFNASQEGTERAARAAGLFGLMQYGQAGKLGNRQLDIANKNAGRGSGGGGGPSPDYLAAIENIYKQRFGEEAKV